jgi:cell division septation protein DedD
VTAAVPTTKKRTSKVVDTKGQVKEKVEVKSDSREKDAPEPSAKAQPTEISTENPALEATKKPTEISQAASKTSIESTEPSAPVNQPSSEVAAAYSMVAAETSPPKKTSWFPMWWWSRTEPVTSAQKKTGETPGESVELSQSDLTDLGSSVPETASSLGTTEEVPFREDLLPSTVEEQSSLEATVTSPVEGLASSAVGGEAATSIMPDSVAQKWLSTVGIRFERKKGKPAQESSSEEGQTHSAIEPEKFTAEPTDPLVKDGFSSVIKSAMVPEVEQTGETPEVVSLVVPFDKEAAEALRETPSGPVESPFSTEQVAPIQKRDVEQPDPDIAQAERHIESRVLRFPREEASHEFQTISVQAEQEVPIRLAASDVGSHSSMTVETESLARRTESRRSSAEKTVRYAAKKNPLSSKSGRWAKWSVQIRAYSREGHARSLANKLQISGFDAYVIGAKVNGRYWYRVRVGRFDSKTKAKATLASIRENKTYSQAYVVINR